MPIPEVKEPKIINTGLGAFDPAESSFPQATKAEGEVIMSP